MVKVPNGGRKKKLKAAVAKTAIKNARRNPQFADVNKTRMRKVRATVVGFT